MVIDMTSELAPILWAILGVVLVIVLIGNMPWSRWTARYFSARATCFWIAPPPTSRFVRHP